jgi:hypothetical protein
MQCYALWCSGRTDIFTGIPFWTRQERRRATDSLKSAPGYIQSVIARLNAKRMKQEVKALKAKKEQENDDRMKQLKGRTRNGRRPTSVMVDFFAKDLAAPVKNALPSTQRKRRSSILTRPSLVEKEKKKVKLPRRKKGKKEQHEVDELVFEDEEEGEAETGGQSPAISPRDKGASSSSKHTAASGSSKGSTSGKKERKTKKKENPKQIHPSFSDLGEFPDEGQREEEKQSPRPHQSHQHKALRYKAA